MSMRLLAGWPPTDLADRVLERLPGGLVELLAAGQHHHAAAVHRRDLPGLHGLDFRPGARGLVDGPFERLDGSRRTVDADDDAFAPLH
jgi:hypothetical protein